VPGLTSQIGAFNTLHVPPTSLRVVALALLLGGCPASAVSYQWSSLPDPNKTPYRIQAGDRINIRVLRNDANTGVYTVRPDGHISLALAGDLLARGLTASELKVQVVERLRKYIENTEEMVAVSIDQVQGIRYSVVGEVTRPGMFETPRYPTVLEGLAAAGGLNTYAQGNAIYVLREQTRIPFSYEQTIKDPSGNRNFYLLNGDVVVVP
jgi:polysaccharide biosynthesis/export protein